MYCNFSTKVFACAINSVRTHLGGAAHSPRRLTFNPRLINVGFVVDGVLLRLYRYITLLNVTHLGGRNSKSAFRLYMHLTLTYTLHSIFVRILYQEGGSDDNFCYISGLQVGTLSALPHCTSQHH